jgi:hypothetical protein
LIPANIKVYTHGLVVREYQFITMGFVRVKVCLFLNRVISMAENIKIYRNSNPRLGFLLNEASIANVYVDEGGLRRLISFINQQFLICSNQQSQCLLEGCIDLDNQFISVFCIAIVLPLAKAVALDHFGYLFAEYLLVFALTALYLARRFSRSAQMKQKYWQAEEELELRFQEIQEEFNQRFDYLRMEYVRTYDESEEDYL